MGIVDDFDKLYTKLKSKYDIKYQLSCQNDTLTTTSLTVVKTYFCCGVTNTHKKCVLHACVVVIIGTWLDKQFRGEESDYGFSGTFVIDGRHFSFPNIMMNNNVLIHNFFDKQYARDKKMKRMFLYGNYDDDKSVNRAIQLVYDKHDDILYVRDVYAKDYVVDRSINDTLKEYLKCSGKWPDMDFAFVFNDYNEIFEQLKKIMSVNIPYQIDSLSNKIIYKHSYLIELTYNIVFNKMKHFDNLPSEFLKKKVILFAAESKKIYDIIVTGKIIQSVSKTLSKQKKYDQEYNSNNNNLEVFPLKHRIGNEVLRLINENMQQDMLKHTEDYVKFIDSFFHGEMTIAGKKFFLCHNTVLPDVDYKSMSNMFKMLIEKKLFFDKYYEYEYVGQKKTKKNFNEFMLVAFNDRPTKFYCRTDSLYKVYYYLKRAYFPVEIKVDSQILCINHHEGMIMLKKVVLIDNHIYINTLQTPFEYHNSRSLINSNSVFKFHDNIKDTTTSLMSTMILEYYTNYLHIFDTIPVAKLIVSLTNLKNGMVVQKNNYKTLPIGNSVVVDDSIYCNDRMFYLWTLVMDSCLKTAEDPYIPHHSLPVKIYHNKIYRVKGKIIGELPVEVFVYRKAEINNIILVEGEHYLCLFGTLVCNNKINWNYDGKKYKIEYCVSKQLHVYKFYTYFRKVKNQSVLLVNSEVMQEDYNFVYVKLELVYSVNDLEGLKICSVHGQKGVLNESNDLSQYVADDDTNVHAQICLSPISYLSRQTNFKDMSIKYCHKNGKKYPLILIPYMFFNNTPDNIYKEFIGKNITGYEKLEGTRLDQWSINQSFMGNRISESLHCIRNGNNIFKNSGQYNVFQTLLHCNNIKIVD